MNFEEFVVGNSFTSGPKSIAQEDIFTFANLTGDLNRLHLDEEYAKTTIFGKRIAHGLLTLSIAVGLWYSLNLANESMVAFLGLNKVSFMAPVFAGDSITLSSKVVSKRESKSNPKAGIVVFEDEVSNDTEVVLRYERTFLISR